MLSQEQLALRRHGITATDVAAIIGVSPFAGPLDVYLEKTGFTGPRADSEAMRWGRDLEPLILRRYADDAGVELETPGTLRHHLHPELLGTPDATIVGRRKGVEAKTTGSRSAHLWGDVHTNTVPAHHIVQCAMYMAICDAEAWDLAVLIGGQDYRVYTFERDEELEDWLVEAALAFWTRHVVAEVPPPVDASASARRFLAELYPRNNGVVLEATPEAELWADRLREARAAVAAARALEAEAENRLKSLIGEADGLKGSFFSLYWRRSKDVAEVDYRLVLERLSEDDPKLAERAAALAPDCTRIRSGARSFRTYFKTDPSGGDTG